MTLVVLVVLDDEELDEQAANRPPETANTNTNTRLPNRMLTVYLSQDELMGRG